MAEDVINIEYIHLFSIYILKCGCTLVLIKSPKNKRYKIHFEYGKIK